MIANKSETELKKEFCDDDDDDDDNVVVVVNKANKKKKSKIQKTSIVSDYFIPLDQDQYQYQDFFSKSLNEQKEQKDEIFLSPNACFPPPPPIMTTTITTIPLQLSNNNAEKINVDLDLREKFVSSAENNIEFQMEEEFNNSKRKKEEQEQKQKQKQCEICDKQMVPLFMNTLLDHANVPKDLIFIILNYLNHDFMAHFFDIFKRLEQKFQNMFERKKSHDAEISFDYRRLKISEWKIELYKKYYRWNRVYDSSMFTNKKNFCNETYERLFPQKS